MSKILRKCTFWFSFVMTIFIANSTSSMECLTDKEAEIKRYPLALKNELSIPIYFLESLIERIWLVNYFNSPVAILKNNENCFENEERIRNLYSIYNEKSIIIFEAGRCSPIIITHGPFRGRVDVVQEQTEIIIRMLKVRNVESVFHDVLSVLETGDFQKYYIEEQVADKLVEGWADKYPISNPYFSHSLSTYPYLEKFLWSKPMENTHRDYRENVRKFICGKMSSTGLRAKIYDIKYGKYTVDITIPVYHEYYVR